MRISNPLSSNIESSYVPTSISNQEANDHDANTMKIHDDLDDEDSAEVMEE